MTMLKSLVLIATIGWTSYGYAQPPQCFFEVEQAYTYLLEQQQVQQNLANKIINLNTATEGELTQLKGIGSHKAQQIISYRKAFGNFEQIEDLAKVKGIGEKTVAKNRALMSVDPL